MSEKHKGDSSCDRYPAKVCPATCVDGFVSNDLSVLCKVAFLWQVLRLLNEHCGKEYSVHLCDEW